LREAIAPLAPLVPPPLKASEHPQFWGGRAEEISV